MSTKQGDREFTQEELKTLTGDIQAVLTKHGAEIGVTSTINLMKNDKNTTKEEEISDSKTD